MEDGSAGAGRPEESGAAGTPPADEWGWTAELSPAHLRTLAPVGLELWRRGNEWVNRRVETIDLLDVDTVDLKLSIDFRIPKKLPGGLKLGGLNTFCLPLTVLPRRTSLAYFDVRDESGASLPLLTRTENARLTGAILIAAARRALAPYRNEVEQPELSPVLVAYLAAIPRSPRLRTRFFVRSILTPDDAVVYPDSRTAEVLLHDQEFRDLLGLAASCSFVHVPLVAEPGERRIIKIRLISPWDSPPAGRSTGTGKPSPGEIGHRMLTWLGWLAETRYLIMPHVGNAETFHVQISAPERVEFTEAGMRNGPPSDLVRPEAEHAPDLPKPDDSGTDNPNDAVGYQQFEGGISERKHLYVDKAHAHRTGIIWVRFRVVRHGFLRAAVAVAWLTTLLLGLFAFRADSIVGDAQTAAALLLLVPALIAGFLIAPGEHAMTRHLLRGPRLLTAGVGLLALLAATAMLTLPDPGATEAPRSLVCSWVAAAAIAGVLSILLTISTLFPSAGKRDTSSPPAKPESPFIGPQTERDQRAGETV